MKPLKLEKPAVLVQCADCGQEVAKRDSCLWRAGKLSVRLCQKCASARMKTIR